MIWIKDKPILDNAWYWYRPTGLTNKEATPVWIQNHNEIPLLYENGEWSHRPIPFPDSND